MAGHHHHHEHRNVPAIRVEHLSVAFGSQIVLDDISFEVREGTITALIGPNGSGKTTLLRAILGLSPSAEGSIAVFGKHPHAARGVIGYVPQQFDFDQEFPITVGEFLALGQRDECVECSTGQAVVDVGLGIDILSKRLGTLSGGQLQRVLIAQAILNAPPLLVLDEPSTGIDVAGEAAFYDVIRHLNRDHGTTVLIVSHDISMIANVVDEVLCLNRKLLCAGPPGQALSKQTMHDLYGKDTEPFDHAGHHPHRESRP
jgi:ABC-type Mn2+/Zn2+ transport system ATPase subunit